MTRRLTILLVFLLLASLLASVDFTPVKAAVPWASAYTDWQYRRPITINNPNSADLTDFQVKITLDSSNFDFSKANSDGSDIRFADATGNTIPYYIESWDSTNQRAVIWIKVPSIPASGSTTVYMYYGNSEATSESNGDAVFEFFDDFDTFDSSKWYTGWLTGGSYDVQNGELTVVGGSSSWEAVGSKTKFTAPVVVEFRAKVTETNYIELGLDERAADGTYSGSGYSLIDWRYDTGHVSGGRGYTVVDEGSFHFYQRSTDLSSYTILTLVWTSSKIQWYENGVLGKEVTSGIPSDPLAIALVVKGSSTSITVDWVRVRKYAEQEPSASVSTTEETNNSAVSHTVTLRLKDNAGNSLSGVSIIVKDSSGTIILSGAYSDGDTISLGDGTYNFLATKAHYIRAEQNGVSISADTTVALTLTAIPTPSISYSPNPPHVGDTVTATASASNLPSGYTYTYEYRFEDGSGNVLQDWSTTNTYTIPVALAHSTIVVKARIKVEETGDYSEVASTTIDIANTPPTTPTSITSDKDVLSTTDTVTFTASGSTDKDGDSITYQYKIVDTTTGQTIRDWGTENSLYIDPSIYQHTIRVYARAYDGRDYSGESYKDFTVSNSPPTVPTNITIYPAVFRLNTDTSISASGSTDKEGDTMTYQYKIVDTTTGTVLQDWSTTNTYTVTDPSLLFHMLTIYARAWDGHVFSPEHSETFFVMPQQRIEEYPFDKDKVKSEVVFKLSNDILVAPLLHELGADDSGFVVWRYFEDYNGNYIIEWAQISQDSITVYSTSPLSPWVLHYNSYPDIGTTKWEEDFVEALIAYAKTKGWASSAAAVTDYNAYVDGIYQNATLWLWSGYWYGQGILSNTLTRDAPFANNNASNILITPFITAQWYLSSDWRPAFKLDVYDTNETANAKPEVSTGNSRGLLTVDLSGFNSWRENKTVNLYLYGYAEDSMYIAFRLVGIAKPGAESAVHDRASKSGDNFVVFNVQPLPLDRKITFFFKDTNMNPLNGVHVYLAQSANDTQNLTSLGVFNNGDTITLEVGHYNFVFSKDGFQSARISMDIFDNMNLYVYLIPEGSGGGEVYTLTLLLKDGNGNSLTGVSIYVDGTPIGTYNNGDSITIQQGTHIIRADKIGYSPEEITVNVQDNTIVTLTLWKLQVMYGVNFNGTTYGTATGVGNLNEFSVVVIFNATNLTGEHSILDARKWGTDWGGWNLRVESGKLAFRVVHNSSGSYKEAFVSANISASRTYLATAVFSGGTASLYLDGALAASVPVSNDRISTTDPTLWIGEYRNSMGHFEGTIYEILIYNRTLSYNEIQAIYADPLHPPTSGLTLFYAPDSVDPSTNIWRDKSDSRNDGTIHGATYTLLSIPSVSYYDAENSSPINPLDVSVAMTCNNTTTSLLPGFLTLPYNSTVTLNVSAVGYESRTLSILATIDSLAVYLEPAQSNQTIPSPPNWTNNFTMPDVNGTGWSGWQIGKEALSLHFDKAIQMFFTENPNSKAQIFLPFVIWLGMTLLGLVFSQSPLVALTLGVITQASLAGLGAKVDMRLLPGVVTLYLFLFIWTLKDFIESKKAD